MGTQSSKMWFIVGGVAVLALAAGSIWLAERQVEKQVRTEAERSAREFGGVATIEQVKYSLLRNQLELLGVGLTFTDTAEPMEYTLKSALVRNPNRSLVLAMATGDIGTQRGVQSVADEVLLTGYKAVSKGNTAQISVVMELASQSIAGITADMDTLAPLLVKESPSTAEIFLGVAQGVAYARRSIPAGLTVKIDSAAVDALMTMDSMEEANYARCALESNSVKGIRMDMDMKVGESREKALLTIDEMTLNHMYIAPEAIKLAAEAEQNPAILESRQQELLKVLFLNERPLLGSLTIKNSRFETSGETFSFGTFIYENSSTKPFALTLSMNNLRMPLDALTSDPFTGMLLNSKEVDLSLRMDSLVAVADSPKTDPLSKFALTTSVAGMGAVTMQTEGRFPDGFFDDMVQTETAQTTTFADSFLVKQLSMSYTDEGLVPRAMLTAQKSMGLGTELVLPLLEKLITENMGTSATPKSKADVAKIMEFMRFPGVITATVTPEPATTLDALSKMDLAEINTDITVVKGEKNLQERVDALSK